MSEATLIIDALLQKLRDGALVDSADQIVDDELQIDEYTLLPIIHLREINEQPPVRHGRDYKRTRRIQIDVYQSFESTRADRDQLLDDVLRVLYPSPTGLKLEGTRLSSFTPGAIALEPDEIQVKAKLTQLPITFEYLSTL